MSVSKPSRMFVCRSIRAHVCADVIFTREAEDGEQRIPAYFSSRVFDVDDTQKLVLDDLVADLDGKVEHWNSRGSGYVLDCITKFVLVITKYRPLCGSTYIPTPQWLAKKQCLVNVKNSDTKCFLWSILSALHPGAHDPNRISNYRKYELSKRHRSHISPGRSRRVEI